jgi:RNA polymerase sigma factor (sigma-70 family)
MLCLVTSLKHAWCRISGEKTDSSVPKAAILEERPDRQHIREILRALSSDSPAQAWAAFLDTCSPVILQVVNLFENNADAVADGFLFVCEQLSKNRFHRLKQFREEGAASFTTWLRLVVRRLCIDWHRKEFGRSRIFESIGRLSDVDQAVFRTVYEDGMRADGALPALRARFPQLTQAELQESCERIQQSLSSRQLWLLSTRKPKLSSLDWMLADDRESQQDQVRDPAPDPETVATNKQQQGSLNRALAGLTAGERLLIRLRYEQELTLEQVARVAGLPDPQTADRRLKQILDRLRKAIGKGQPASV